MAVVVWIAEGTWPACVEAARVHAAQGAEIVLLHVTGTEVPGVAHGAFAGLLGRGHPKGQHQSGGWGSDPGTRLEDLAADSSRQLLQAAAELLGRPCVQVARTGRIEREVVAATEGADLLVLARDGDRTHLGPHSLGPAGRFVVDHAACPVLLVWPGAAPAGPPPPAPPRHR
ncbi:nucleotide-binding universal stress UspA family protein [Kitasatospora sp. MAA4]|uniref:universal stress protein n=1 Tax=Kitasatospora sp. MAA4 TaxID=3035093 RepID=UPI00247718B5|nr:universal stress protein [Kitasatospora sp. MAA4]MDH6137553.1 nucleotide-binding universal stress UspA family protein [Kitasatospora sp. MAA4]